MKKILTILFLVIGIFCFIDKANASEAKCVYGDHITITIKDGKIQATTSLGYTTIKSTLKVSNFTNSNEELECLEQISADVSGSGRTATFSLSPNSGSSIMKLDKSKSSVINDPKTGDTEKVLLRCSYNNNFLIKTTKQIKYEFANGYNSNGSIPYEDIGTTCPEKVYLLCTTRGGNYCRISLEYLTQSTAIPLDGTTLDADELNGSEDDTQDKDDVKDDTDNVEINIGFFGNLDTVKCGNVDMPSQIPSITRTIVALIKIAVPIILIIMGMIDMLQATIASDEKKMSDAKGKFIKRLISAAVVFLVVAIVQFLVGIVAPEESPTLSNCIDCMISDASKCIGS